MSLYRILFVSKQSHEMKDAEAFSILEKSKINNHKKNIRGLLLYINNAFMEVLEGEEEQIKELFHLIRQDARHYQTKIIIQGAIEKRYFEGWNLGYKIQTESDLLDLRAMNGNNKLDLHKELTKHPDIVFEFLKHFYNTGDVDFFKFWNSGERIKID